MTTHLVVVVLLATTLSACSQPSTSKPAESAPASAPASGSAHGLSPDVMEAADELFTFIENNLLGTDAAREPSAGEARRQLAELRAMNKTPEDRLVTLLLAMLLSKDGQRAAMASMGGLGGADTQAEIATLKGASDRCYAELMGWLEYNQTTKATLGAGVCLAEAKASAAVLGI